MKTQVGALFRTLQAPIRAVAELVFAQLFPTAGVDAMVQRELGERATVPQATEDDVAVMHPPRDLFGLALSGGGQRSATFNLGLLQGLHERGVLRCFDYLSTVSGGGYIGGFWTAWRRRGGGGIFPASEATASPEEAMRPEPPEIRHLREFSKFLSPRGGGLSYDTWRTMAAGVAALVPTLLMSLSVIVLALFVWLALMHLMATGATVAELDGGLVLWQPRLVLLGTLALVWAVAERRWRRREGAPAADGRFLLVAVLTLPTVLAAWVFAQYLTRSLGYYPDAAAGAFLIHRPPLQPGSAIGMFEPAIALLLATCVVAIARALLSVALSTSEVTRFAPSDPRAGESWSKRLAWRSAIDRVTGRTLALAGAWAAFAALWVAGVALYDVAGFPSASFAAGAGAIASLLFARAQRLVSRQPSRPMLAGWRDRLRPMLPRVLAYTVVAALVLLVVIAVLLGDAAGQLPALAAAALVITLLGLWFFEPNTVGIHAFYRARLARAFLGASNDEHRSAEFERTEEHATDDLSIAYMPEADERKPVHLICCAANDLSHYGGMRNLERGAESAVLSPAGFSVAHEWRAWTTGDQVPTLGAAMTASGAAFNTLMGERSKQYGPAVSFLMATLNLRLGLWLRHPTYPEAKRGILGNMRGLPFYKELFGIADSNDALIHLSDGGHFENMGVYELIRRHCRVIVCADCGMDPQLAFDDLGNLVRRVRADFNVEIRIDVSPLKPRADGFARQTMVAGDIHYPAGDTGVILLIKPTLTGSEPIDVAQYHVRNPHFPHESTLDQFYDEAQWESYRRLGQHIAYAAFPQVPNHAGVDHFNKLFSTLRFDWLPAPAGYAESEPRLLAARRAVEELLLRAECAALRAEVNGDATPGTRTAMPDELPVIFHTLCQAIDAMQQVHQAHDLDSRQSHPLNLEWMNWIGRWVNAPSFVYFWPLLRARGAVRVTRFLERAFGLPGAPAASLPLTLRPAQADRGLAMRAWRAQHGSMPAGAQALELVVRLMHPGRPMLEVAVAALVYRHDGDVVHWDAQNLFVPAGFWGLGFGSELLRQATGPTSPIADALHVVRVARVSSSPALRKAGADRAALYRAAAFAQAWLHEGVLYGARQIWRTNAPMLQPFDAVEPESTIWFARGEPESVYSAAESVPIP